MEKTGILIILDGFGIAPEGRFNAVTQASTPNWTRFLSEYSHSQLQASEKNVGLPQGFMGNSEVGHLNIGAGRIVYQDFSLISKAIEDESFFKNPALVSVMKKTHESHKALHLMGLVSDGGVHSHISHLYALLKMAKQHKIENCYVHVFTDGRDTSPTSGVDFVAKLQKFIADIKYGEIATVEGRFYAMDRDQRWERTELAFESIVEGKSDLKFSDAKEFIESQYQKEVTDEFLLPGTHKKYNGMDSSDGVIFFNFRADRARQLTRAMTEKNFDGFRRSKQPQLCQFVMMTPYDQKFELESAFSKPVVPNTLGEIVSKQGWTQLRIAETEKYAHVTYFFNGGNESVFEGEKRMLVPSPREVKTYDLKPEMSAFELTKTLMKELNSGDYQFVVVNFANPDMVGHTGNLRAAISAVETIDECLGKIIGWVEKEKGFAIITADHGNCEKMVDDYGKPLTSHTLSPVPFVVIDPSHPKLKTEGKLCDIAPTVLELYGIPKPKEMTGQSMIVKS